MRAAMEGRQHSVRTHVPVEDLPALAGQALLVLVEPEGRSVCSPVKPEHLRRRAQTSLRARLQREAVRGEVAAVDLVQVIPLRLEAWEAIPETLNPVRVQRRQARQRRQA